MYSHHFDVSLPINPGLKKIQILSDLHLGHIFLNPGQYATKSVMGHPSRLK